MPARPHLSSSPRPDAVRRAVAEFAVSGVVALLVFAVVAGLAMRREGEEESVRDARTLGAAIARGVVEPALAEGIERSEPGAVSRLDAVVRRGVLGDAVVRVKLWDRSGTIVYSDEPRLIGSRYPLGEDERGALRGDAVEAEVSELGQPENRFEQSHGQLLEVYLPVTTPDGTKLLFESYQPLSSIAADGSRTWRAFAPAVLGALLLLWLVQIPLATSLARRVRNGRRDREALLLQAVAASEDERYRIAADLHDGVVQDLAGVAFTLSATADRIAPADAAAAAGLSEAAETMRTSMRRLRSLIVEIYPPNLESVGLGAALRDLVAPLSARGLDVELEVPPERLPGATEAVFYRVAQEALRNVVRHAGASRARVRVSTDAGCARLVVEDDGVGLPAAVTVGPRRDGHLGLRLVGDLARGAGGRLELGSSPDGGARVTVEVPTS